MGLPGPGVEPWWSKAGAAVLTERGLATLLTLVLVGAMLWGQYRLITDARETGNAQVAQQERLIVRLDEALEHLTRIEALLARGSGAGFVDVSGELERINGRLTGLERKAAAP